MPSIPKTTIAKKETTTPGWFVLDADNKVVGRLANQISTVLMGKHKPIYTPHVDCGDCVIVLNAEKVRFTGAPLAHPSYPYHSSKMAAKIYERYTGYPGGRKTLTGIEVWERSPEKILYEAVRRMLPKNKLARQMIKKLKLYTGENHPHQAQNPQPFPEYLLNKTK